MKKFSTYLNWRFEYLVMNRISLTLGSPKNQFSIASKISSMKKYCVFGIFLFTFACAPSSQDADFKVFIKSFHQSKWKQFPIWAAQAGHSEFYKILPIPSRKKHESDLQFCKKYNDSLESFDANRLSVPLQFEYKKIKPFLTNQIYNFETLKIHENDPTYYDLREVLNSILNLKITKTEQYLEVVASNLKLVPEYYSAAIENLINPDQQKLQEAIAQQIQFYTILDEQIIAEFKDSNLTESQLAGLSHLILAAKLSVKDFIAFCKSKEFEYFDEALNAVPASSPKEEFEKIFTVGN